MMLRGGMKMSSYYEDFRNWLDRVFYEGFDPSDLSDDEYAELEDRFQKEVCGR